MTCGNERAKRFHHFSGLRGAGIGYLSSPETPRRPCVGAGAPCPEKGGALRNQSTRGRRLGVAAVICGALFVAPLLLLKQHGRATHRWRRQARVHGAHASVVHAASHLDGVNLRSHLVAYHARRRRPRRRHPPATTTTTAPAPTTTTTTTTAPPPTTTTTTAPPPPPPTTTTTTAPPAPHEHRSRRGDLVRGGPAGHVRQPDAALRDGAHGGQRRHRRVDRVHGRRPGGAGYPRVVDMSPEGFSQIADLGQGVVDVTISW